ncbi:MAG: histidinol-phosphate transaminase [Thermodesulfobacteriota bacterium]
MEDKEMRLKVSRNIEELVPYPPGKPIEELERELGISGSVKMASNENPVGPSPKALKAVTEALSGINRYPDGGSFYLREKLSARLGLPMEQIITGNGSNEIIELLIRTFLASGEETVMGEPSFAVYPLVTKAAGGVPVMVPLKDMRLDLEAMREAVNEMTRIVFIANPNNPTGTAVKSSELRRFIHSMPEDVIICLDEAYREYVTTSEYEESTGYLESGRAVIILRTFSKIYGLSGLRAGYGIGPAKMIDYLNRVRQPFNMNSLAQAAALAAIDDREHVERSRSVNAEGLKYLYGELDKMGLPYVPTEANFFLINVGEGAAVYRGLLKKGVIVRPMASYGLGSYIRLTVGLPEENARFISSLTEVLNDLARKRA